MLKQIGVAFVLWLVVWVGILLIYLGLSGHRLAEHGGAIYLVLTIAFGFSGGVFHAVFTVLKLKFFDKGMPIWPFPGLSVNLTILVPLIIITYPHDGGAIMFFVIVAALLFATAFVIDIFLSRYLENN
ncbi:MAG: hypothetical protein R8M46_02710 [Ghiorsea sp.]